MKKIITAWLLIAAMLSLSITAYAQDAKTGSMTVTYEYTAPISGGETSTYTVNIPASVTIAESGTVVPISISKNDVAAGKKVAVGFDWDKTFDSNGYFHLYKSKGEINVETIRCRILLYSDMTTSTMYYADYVREATNYYVAEFASGSFTPTFGGYLCFQTVIIDTSVTSGTYTGVLYFDISVEDI